MPQPLSQAPIIEKTRLKPIELKDERLKKNFLDTTHRVRSKQYAKAHWHHIQQSQYEIIRVNEPWTALRYKGVLMKAASQDPLQSRTDAPPPRPSEGVSTPDESHNGENGEPKRSSALTPSKDPPGNSQEKPGSMTSLPPKATESKRSKKSLSSRSRKTKSRLEDKPSTSSFFLTGTHLEEDDQDANYSDVESVSDTAQLLDQMDLDRYFAEYRLPTVPQWDAPLPGDITTSVRVLRRALRNPVYYWRMYEKSYAQPTHAVQRKTLPSWKKKLVDAMFGTSSVERRDAGVPAKSASLAATDGPEGTAEEAQFLAKSVSIHSPVNSEWSGASLEDLEERGLLYKSMRTGSTAWKKSGVKRKKKKKKVTGMDGLEELRNTMRKVHYKLQLLEEEMARVAAEENKRKRERDNPSVSRLQMASSRSMAAFSSSQFGSLHQFRDPAGDLKPSLAARADGSKRRLPGMHPHRLPEVDRA